MDARRAWDQVASSSLASTRSRPSRMPRNRRRDCSTLNASSPALIIQPPPRAPAGGRRSMRERSRGSPTSMRSSRTRDGASWLETSAEAAPSTGSWGSASRSRSDSISSGSRSPGLVDRRRSRSRLAPRARERQPRAPGTRSAGAPGRGPHSGGSEPPLRRARAPRRDARRRCRRTHEWAWAESSSPHAWIHARPDPGEACRRSPASAGSGTSALVQLTFALTLVSGRTASCVLGLGVRLASVPFLGIPLL